jgi:hypothetical protein
MHLKTVVAEADESTTVPPTDTMAQARARAKVFNMVR